MKFDLLIAGGEVLGADRTHDPRRHRHPLLSLPQWTIDESPTQPDKPWRYPQE